MTSIAQKIDQLGRVVDNVVLEVDYQIIEHFSEHLYDSPNKAVEELVANGFDAFATEARVFVPGPYVSNRVMVWDNGQSMGIEGLKKLWWIAKSPKEGDRIVRLDDQERKLIGKFGIGKLASYSVGNVISHLCRHQGEFYLVCVDYQKVGTPQNGDVGTSSSPMTTPIVALTEANARDLTDSLFENTPESFEQSFCHDSWTLAIIEELKIKDLRVGRLSWVLGNGMPLRPDFALFVNDNTVASKLNKEAVVYWDFGSPEVVDTIESRWNELRACDDETSAVPHEIPSDDISFGHGLGLDPRNPDSMTPYVELPTIGRVWGEVRLFDETLLKHRAADNGRSHGFFLMVRGRLTNHDDDKLYIPDPSFQTFFRSQFIIHADGLDDALLADRQRLRGGQGVRELELLQRALMGVARSTVEARDEERAESESARSALPIHSREFFRGPINALALRAPVEEVAEFDPSTVAVDRKELGANEALSVMDFADQAIRVNLSHPLYSVLHARAGQSKAGREFLRTVDMFAATERLLEGHLLDVGFGEHEVSEIVTWRDELFRQLAKSYGDAPVGIIEELERASFPGGTSFELAVTSVFEDMGFVAKHAGGGGEEDVLVMATVGPRSYKFVAEAKGSKGAISNDAAEVGAAASHRDRTRADFAVIVARQFAGLDVRGTESAVYRECAATERVSLMTVEALEQLHTAVTRFSYPLDTVRDILLALETPTDKLTRIDRLNQPQRGFDYKGLLDQVWARQEDEAAGSVVPYRSVFQQGGWRERLGFEDFERRLIALETLAAGRVHVDQQAHEVHLRQAPSLIVDQIGASLEGIGADVTGKIGRED